jgi:hypothetical protein
MMTISKLIAKQWRGLNDTGNWTGVNMKDTLAGVNWQMATAKQPGLHSIAELVFHMHYYIRPILNGLHGKPLDARDQFSFDLPAIRSEQDWQELVKNFFTDSELLAAEIEKVADTKLSEDFSDPKYGSMYRNLHGIIEHTYYHLGQINLIKKLLKNHGS